MLDMSNKLHAMVDEFVNSLTSVHETLANNASTEAHLYVARDRAVADAQTQRQSNRTTSEVLNGLKRPSSTPSSSSHHDPGKLHVEHVKLNLQARNNRLREEGKNLRHIKDKKAKTAALLNYPKQIA